MMNDCLQVLECKDKELQNFGFHVGTPVKIISANKSGVLFSVNNKTFALDYECVKKLKFGRKKL